MSPTRDTTEVASAEAAKEISSIIRRARCNFFQEEEREVRWDFVVEMILRCTLTSSERINNCSETDSLQA